MGSNRIPFEGSEAPDTVAVMSWFHTGDEHVPIMIGAVCRRVDGNDARWPSVALVVKEKQLDARGAPREEAEIGASFNNRCTQGRARTDSCCRVHGFAFSSSSLRPFRRLLLCAKTSLLHFGLSENLSVGGLISKKLTLGPFRWAIS